LNTLVLPQRTFVSTERPFARRRACSRGIGDEQRLRRRTRCSTPPWWTRGRSTLSTSALVITPSATTHADRVVTEGQPVAPSPPIPIREGSRDGHGGCLVCGKDTPSPRAKYCGRAHQQRSYRLRHQPPTADLTRVRKELLRRKALVDHTVYECGQCGERFVGVRRCESCNRFCAALGPGGACPDCDRPVLVDDLLGEGVFTRA
jgi:hypothetical protein